MKVEIIDYGMNGEGVGKIEGKVTLIPNALVGEVVDANMLTDHGNYMIGQATHIMKPSASRQVPPCPYFYKCGGCNLQHMNYAEQLKFKQILIQKTLKKICNIDFDVSPTVACDTNFNYRNKATFNLKNNSVGFFEASSKEIVEIENCLLSTENINKILKIFKNYVNNNENLADLIKNLIIREINNQILVGVVAKSNVDLMDFFTLLKGEFLNIGLYIIINTRKDSVVISGTIKHIAGIKNIQIENFGLTYFVDLVGFHQTNINIQNKLYNKVLDYVSANAQVVNGFSGQGLLSAILSKKARSVVGIEIEKSSHLSAEALKKQNNIANLKNILGDFGKHFNSLKPKTDILVLDPSKKGCGKKIMQDIIGVKEILYISCNPIALCKDLNLIKEYYDIEEIIPFDMFPNTLSVETLVKLKKKEI